MPFLDGIDLWDNENMLRIGFISLGCPKNLVDSEKIMGLLLKEGYKIVHPEDADVVIINTCAFLDLARKENHAVIERWKDKGKKIIIAGCLVTYYGEEINKVFPFISGSIGIADLSKISQVLRKPSFYFSKNGNNYLTERVLTTFPWAYLKISEGCSNRCSYCLIPELRGEYRSYPPELLLAEARALAESGVKEIILVGQDTAIYGKEWEEWSIARLIREISKISGIEWIRVMYLHPRHITRELIECVAENEKVVKYLDIPIQHCNDKILARMNRGITKRELFHLFQNLRNKIRNLTLRTTVMVGFPGEGEREFKELKSFLEEIEFERVGVFAYSQEPGTPASFFKDQVDEKVKEARKKEIYSLQKEIMEKKDREIQGKVLKVLIEGEEKGYLIGRSERDAPEIDEMVKVKGDVKIGEIVKVKIKKVGEYFLEGETL
ncbi:MAG TPA: 30S ribosomal protein S12 methylthiotransferase RimO [bacterium]|nr:30S ribosomal protein S12 methylthiotransferase RimO [bacterium]HEX67650.1 30S ribosomal protein S12 methylthiotransferase RimO [bacterium]